MDFAFSAPALPLLRNYFPFAGAIVRSDKDSISDSVRVIDIRITYTARRYISKETKVNDKLNNSDKMDR